MNKKYLFICRIALYSNDKAKKGSKGEFWSEVENEERRRTRVDMRRFTEEGWESRFRELGKGWESRFGSWVKG